MLTDSGNALNAVAVRTAPDEVYKLDPNYWRESVSSRPLLFLELFSPTCGHCKALEPEFIAANKTIELNGFTDITLMGMDATKSAAAAELMEHVGAKGYPTLVLFRGGPDDFTLYEGERTSVEMVRYLEGEIKQFLRRKYHGSTRSEPALPDTGKTPKGTRKQRQKGKGKGKGPSVSSSSSPQPPDEQLTQLLTRLGLERLSEVFAREEIDMQSLRLLRESDFDALGIRTGPRLKLMQALGLLRDNGADDTGKTEL